jgi:DNA-binding NarL/FixJ family response regulator
MNILLVDNHPITLLALRATLLQLGIAARITGILSADVPRYAAQQGAAFDVAFVDVNASGNDGYKSLATLRAARPEAPLVVVCAFDGNVDIPRAREMGASSFVSGRPGIGTLLDAIHQTSGRRFAPV